MTKSRRIEQLDCSVLPGIQWEILNAVINGSVRDQIWSHFRQHMDIASDVVSDEDIEDAWDSVQEAVNECQSSWVSDRMKKSNR